LNDDDGNHLAFDARGDRTTAEEKSSPHPNITDIPS